MSDEKEISLALARLTDLLVEDILAMTDEEILAEAEEMGEDPVRVDEGVRRLCERAIAEQAKAKLIAARVAVDKDRGQSPARPALVRDARVARQLLNETISRHPEAARRLTMAARKGGEDISDNDVFSLLEDLEELGLLPPSTDED